MSRTLTINPRQWNISRLSTLPKYPVPMPEFEKLRPAELAQINAARRMDTGATGWRQPFTWPATGRISTLFGSQRIYRNGEAGSYHSGTDIAVPQGTPVLAPADGVVILVSDHPFLLEGISRYLSAPNHPDALIVAAPRVSFSRGQLGSHGGPTAEESYVPVLLRNASLRGSAPIRTNELLKLLFTPAL